MYCLICSSPLTSGLVLDKMPSAAQAFSKSPDPAKKAQLSMSIYECSCCGTVQYTGPVVPYFKNVIRSAKFSEEMLRFRQIQFKKFLDSFDIRINSVFEFGAGEGEYLDIFKNLGCKTAGIENSKDFASICQEKGHDVVVGFLDEGEHQPLLQKKKYDAAISFNFLEHVPNPKACLLRLAKLLRSDGVALLEVPNFELIENKGLFNEFIPDHRFYFREETFRTLLNLSGFQVHSMNSIWDDYILSAEVSKRTPIDWARYSASRLELRLSIEAFFSDTNKAENVVWSAGHQSLATISNLGLEKIIQCVIDSSSEKQKMFCPASGLPVVKPEVLQSKKIKKVLLLAAGYNSEILKKIRRDFPAKLIVAFVSQGKLIYDKDNPTS